MYQAVELLARGSDFEADVGSFVDRYVALWQGAPATAPPAAESYGEEERRVNESATDRMIQALARELRQYPGRPRRQAEWRDRMFASLRRFAALSFRIPESHCDIIFSREYLDVTRAFVRRGREFDPGMDTAALAQALRNVWVTNCLQMFLGRPPSLSPSIFAYSMLYPYTDNYLDRPGERIESKEIACRRLGLRLSGHGVAACDGHEAAIFRLVSMIEGEYPRDCFPDVYAALLAIHAGQVQSLRQQNRSAALDTGQLLRISVAKGGASVLADGWLAAGRLEREEADFSFGYGVLLQLMDDLQDLTEDRAAGHWTLFTKAAETGCLDGVTNRLWNFMHGVLRGADCFTTARSRELADLVRRNCGNLMLRSMAECSELFSGEYLAAMERRSPLGFEFLRSRSREVKSRFEPIWSGLARQRKLQSVFDLMG